MQHRELFSLDGRVAIVTGAGKGIGYAAAEALVGAGASVLLADNDPHAAAAAVEKLAAPGRVDAAVVDVADPAHATLMVERAIDRFGALDILVNNAAVYPPTPLDNLDDGVVDRLLDVNIKGVLYGTAAAAKVMRPSSTVINIGSLGAFQSPFAGLSLYHATKGAIVTLTRDHAQELGHRGIRVNCVAPGGISTEGNDQISNSPLFSADRLAKIRERTTNRLLGRTGHPDDIASVIVFFASPAAQFITGQTLIVDGGFQATEWA
jgi:NAD(P)-dependent dehydrogenase (short-subunit alcohol dehydrogenase family)